MLCLPRSSRNCFLQKDDSISAIRGSNDGPLLIFEPSQSRPKAVPSRTRRAAWIYPSHEPGNIEHRTSNSEHPMKEQDSGRPQELPSGSGVQCAMLSGKSLPAQRGEVLSELSAKSKFLSVAAPLREIPRVERLGKNHGGYRGETIDIRAVLRDITDAAQTHGWTAEIFHCTREFDLAALHRHPTTGHPPPPARIYISTGIHGDEPAGPLAALRLLHDNRWPDNAELWLCPCLNPAGFTRNTRENAEGIDLNRGYRNPVTPEILAHIAWLQRQPAFDLYLLLHEDWETHGFYLYEQNPDGRPSLAEKMIEGIEKVCPIEQSEMIEGREAKGGIIRPNLDPRARPQWAEAFYLIMRKSRLGYTLEAPSDFPLSVRVNALVTAVHAALKNFRSL